MSNIATDLQNILDARYGKDVRQSIHDAIEDCYTDGRAGSTDLVARQEIEALKAPATTTSKGLVKPDGTTITVDSEGKISAVGGGGGGGTTDYTQLTNKPKINNVELSGNKSLSDLGIQPSGAYVTPSDVATSNDAGLVKPDGTTITVDANGTISAIGGGGGGTSDYSALSNKPQINSVELSGNKSLSDLGIASATDVSDLTTLVSNKASASLVSDAFSSSKTYAQGEFCIYNNTLWKSKVNSNLGQTPTEGSYWTATSCGDELNKQSTYSTTEQVVGTWVDGSILYRKVIEGTVSSESNPASVNISDNVKNVIDVYGGIPFGNGGTILNGYRNADNSVFFSYSAGNGTVNYQRADKAHWGGLSLFFIAYYTKNN